MLCPYQSKPLYKFFIRERVGIMPKAYDLTNQRFGRLIAQYKCNYKKGNKYPWHCICDCGNEVDVNTQDLIRKKTQSCGCLHKEIMSKIGKQTVQQFSHDFKDITNQQFGRLTAIKRLPKEKNKKTKWLCKCSCGNEIAVNINDLESGNTSSCGCMISKGQEKISQLLTLYNIPFETEKSFDSCFYPNSIRKCKFDFFVDNKYLIEYDGIQHYKEISFFQISLEEQRNRDCIKNKWCKEHNIPLIRIPYTQLINLNIQDLLLETSGFII